MTGAGKGKSPEDAANQQDDMRADLTADEYSKLQDMVSEQEEAVKIGSNMTSSPRSSDSIANQRFLGKPLGLQLLYVPTESPSPNLLGWSCAMTDCKACSHAYALHACLARSLRTSLTCQALVHD